MIQTKFVRLEQAAEELGVDADALLIAAFEGRFRVYGLLNVTIDAEYGDFFEETEDGEPVWTPREFSNRRFDYVLLTEENIGHLIRKGRVDVSGSVLSDHDEKGRVWRDGRSAREPLQSLEVTQSDLFVRRQDLALSGETPSPLEDSQSALLLDGPLGNACPGVEGGAASSSGETKKRDSLLVIIAALAEEAGIDIERGAAVSIKRAVHELGASMSEDTIRKVLKEIPEALERRGSTS